MSYPILYKPTETAFNHNGCGILGDCASCFVSEVGNGEFELSMQYPMDGIHFDDIQSRSIIKAKADQFREPQLFRVYNISKPSMNGIVNISAQHISYDLSGIPVAPFSADGVALALSGLRSNAVVNCPFEFWTDKNTAGKFTVPHPASIRSRLGGVQGSILDNYGGEYEFDNFSVKLHNNRGMDRGVSIRYGKNLTSLKQEENCQNIATGIYPYWQNQETGAVVQLSEKIVNAPGEYDFEQIRTVDFTSYFQEQPTEEQLRSATERYINNNEIGVPIVSLDVSFAQLQKSEEYKHLQLLERVSLFDTLSVDFPALKVSARAKAVKIVYNVLLDRVESVTLGSVRANIADTIVEQQKQIEKAPTKTDLQRAKEAATEWLTNGKGYAYFRKDANGNIVDILFMDTQDTSTAVNVMRVGQSGIGFSHNGVNGPYLSAWTIDGKFVADFIAAGNLNANIIRSGSIVSAGENPSVIIDLEKGTVQLTGGIKSLTESVSGGQRFSILNSQGTGAIIEDSSGGIVRGIDNDAYRLFAYNTIDNTETYVYPGEVIVKNILSEFFYVKSFVDYDNDVAKIEIASGESENILEVGSYKGNNYIYGLNDPTADLHAANKRYVDALYTELSERLSKIE